MFIARAVSDLPRTGNLCPSDEDMVPPPNTPAQAELAVEVVAAGAGFALSAEQRRVLTTVVTSGRAVEAVVGPAACGKTTLMRATLGGGAGDGVAGDGVAGDGVAGGHTV